MIIEDIQFIEDLEKPKTAPFHYSRVFKIITDNGEILTPHKTTNRLEYNARSGVPLLKKLSSEITSDFKLLDSKKIEAFMTDDKKGTQIINLVKQFNDITRRSILRITIFQPTSDVLARWNTPEKIKFAEYQAEYLQSKLGSNLITYPFLDLPISDYLAFIDSHHVRNEYQSTIFTLDMGMDPTYLKIILDHMAAKQEPMIIALIHKQWDKTIPQHIIVNSFFGNKKILFFACQVGRKDKDSNTSNTHAISVGSNFDIVALSQGHGYPPNDELILNKIMFYSPSSLLIDNIENTFSDPSRNIIKEFNLPMDNYLDLIHLNRIIKGYKGAEKHYKKYQILFYLARVHEAITSPIIFSQMRERILQKDIIQHINDTNLKNVPMIRGY